MSTPAKTPDSLGVASLRDEVREAILGAILEGEFRLGQRLNLSQLTTRFGVSATPVREALTQLQLGGLVEAIPNRGFFVPTLSPTHLRETYLIISALEALAIRTMNRLSPLALRQLDEANSVLSQRHSTASDALRADRRWHEALITPCGNQTLIEDVGRHRKRVALFELTYMEFAHLRPESLADHERIVKLIRSGEAESAARALETHWYRSIDFLGEGDPVP